MDRTNELKTFCIGNGASLVGVASLELLRGSLPVIPSDLLEPYRYAVVVGIRLDNEIVNGITDRPTHRYAQQYRDANAALDALSEKISGWISRNGYNTAAIPASRIMNETEYLGGLSHKAAARLAGIGWQGKSLLIVNADCGPRFRMATVLTDMPLTPDRPVKNRCGSCTACADACPAGAIKNVSTASHYRDRDEAIDLAACARHCFSFKSDPEIGASVCGVCVRVCPWGAR